MENRRFPPLSWSLFHTVQDRAGRGGPCEAKELVDLKSLNKEVLQRLRHELEQTTGLSRPPPPGDWSVDLGRRSVAVPDQLRAVSGDQLEPKVGTIFLWGMKWGSQEPSEAAGSV